MNKSYKSIWNEALGTYVAAAETATTGGRKSSSTRKARRQPDRAHSGQLALEQRIVFDAALPATFVEAHADATASQDAGVLADLDHLASEQQEPVVVAPAVEAPAVQAPSPVSTASEEVVADADAGEASAPSDGEAQAATPTNEVEVAVPSDASADTDADVSEAQSPVDNLTDPSTDGVPSDAAESESADLVTSQTAEAQATEVHEVEAALDPVESVEPTVERVEIVFVDALVDDAADGLQWHPGEVYVLDANRDGVEQIAEVLNGRTGVDAVHIISHGSAGQLNLGSATLNTSSLSGRVRRRDGRDRSRPVSGRRSAALRL